MKSGTCGKNLKWSLDEFGILTINGNGEMDNYVAGEPPWRSQYNIIREVIIENGVTSIGAEAFHWCENLEEITIPES
ncbi:MAG: hypothetical protein IJT73_08670, partial [Selenomonadaceae bacterium]|nr:hypothetical protein [Selenomonadaceae bacterium]